MLSRKQLIRRA